MSFSEIISMYPVVFFSKKECPYCVHLEKDLESLEIPFQKLMLDNETHLRDMLIEFTSCKTVPQLFIGGKFVGGYKEFTTLCGTGKINSYLAPLGLSANLDF